MTGRLDLIGHGCWQLVEPFEKSVGPTLFVGISDARKVTGINDRPKDSYCCLGVHRFGLTERWSDMRMGRFPCRFAC